MTVEQLQKPPPDMFGSFRFYKTLESPLWTQITLYLHNTSIVVDVLFTIPIATR